MAEGSSSSTEMSVDDSVIRILLVGRNSSGKSSFGKTILKENEFKQRECEVCDGQTQIGEKQVHVINCPDVLDPDVDKEKLKEQLLCGCSAGLSSVLLIVPLKEPVQNEEEILDYIKQLFGPEVQKYIMILFTHEDKLKDLDQTFEELPKDQADLQRLLTECGGNYIFFDIKSTPDDQVTVLLQKIDGIVVENGGKFRMKQMKRSSSKASLINLSAEDPGSSGS